MRRSKIKYVILIDCDGHHRILRRSAYDFSSLISSLSEELSPYLFSNIYDIHQKDSIFD